MSNRHPHKEKKDAGEQQLGRMARRDRVFHKETIEVAYSVRRPCDNPMMMLKSLTHSCPFWEIEGSGAENYTAVTPLRPRASILYTSFLKLLHSSFFRFSFPPRSGPTSNTVSAPAMPPVASLLPSLCSQAALFRLL